MGSTCSGVYIHICDRINYHYFSASQKERSISECQGAAYQEWSRECRHRGIFRPFFNHRRPCVLLANVGRRDSEEMDPPKRPVALDRPFDFFLSYIFLQNFGNCYTPILLLAIFHYHNQHSANGKDSTI